MAIMQRCACAVLPSALLRVHVGALRPRLSGSQDSAVDAVVPAICRVYNKSPLLRFSPVVLWLIGVVCQMLVLFDRFEPGSTHEWLACAAVALTLPVIACVLATLNAKTVRELLKQFETLYVIAYVLGMHTCFGFLFREQPAKLVTLALFIPSGLIAGLLDARSEGGRVVNSRVFFTLNVACLLLYLALVSLKPGAYTDFTFQVGSFPFVASSMVCNTIVTLLVFGMKSLAFSFYEPGSLFVLASAVCCVFLDANALAVLKGAYSLIGQSFGKYAPNKTIETYLKKQRLSVVEFSQVGRGQMSRVMVPAPTRKPERETPDDEESGPSFDARPIVADVVHVDISTGGTGGTSDGGIAVSGAADGGGPGASCPPFGLCA
jgi:hypothetical protein